MLLRATGIVESNIFLLTFGSSCHYLVQGESTFSLFDPGLSVHITLLKRRLENLGLALSNLEKVCITHLHPERVGGIALLRKMAPKIKLLGSASMQNKLRDAAFVRSLYEQDCSLSRALVLPEPCELLEFEEFRAGLTIDSVVSDSDIIKFSSDVSARVVNSVGHTLDSLSYFLLPSRYAVVDEGYGYFRGRDLAAPGGDFDLQQSINSLNKIQKLDVTGLCLPFGGVLVGQLVRKHFAAVIQNTEDLLKECAKAHTERLDDVDILQALKDQFYTPDPSDPILSSGMQRTLDGIWEQVLKQRHPLQS